MPDDAPSMQRYSRAAIEDFMQRCFAAAGLPNDDAGTVAHFMAESDIMGKDSHGIFRLPGYIGRIEAGGFNKTPNIRIEQERLGAEGEGRLRVGQ